ncbi:hypothetical protein PoB_001588200 [Plakobranchus ocellatus]|uniref:Uncharacterized protein n=1 Tax=Plakobranchus ocellatus TaxID=259542 RepID=A0AAV3Z4E5_9GAST|nr:hypothetical protein PoB_001588200 [Plakobranchus ocellatus]
MVRGVGGTVHGEPALRSAGILLSRARVPSPAPWPHGDPENLRPPCSDNLRELRKKRKSNKSNEPETRRHYLRPAYTAHNKRILSVASTMESRHNNNIRKALSLAPQLGRNYSMKVTGLSDVDMGKRRSRSFYSQRLEEPEVMERVREGWER